MSFSVPSQVSATTGSAASHRPRRRSMSRATPHRITAWCTTPTLSVLVIMTGPSMIPESRIQVVPVISPFPLRVNQAA